MAISQRAGLAGGRLDDWLASLPAAGIDAVQIREKDLPDHELFRLAWQARRILPASIRVLVNGRLDIALAADADGVHLPASGLPVAELRARFGRRPLIGRSTHHLAEIEQAGRDGADYVTFGPVWTTPGKERAVGIETFARATSLGVPVLAIGGVDPGRFSEVAAAGGVGAAAIRIFHSTESPAEIADAARHAFAPPNRLARDPR